MNINYGTTEAQALSKRLGGAAATTAAMAAFPASRRDDGMLVIVLADYSLWVFEAASVVAASATIIAPAAGTGRWHRLAVAAAA